jgi:hypothetical protein
MENDCLRLFNLNLVQPIVRMNDDELWNFLLENEKQIKILTDRENGFSKYPVGGFLYAYPHGIDWFKKHFLSHIEDYREGVIFSTVMDFCFKGEEIYLDYAAKCAFLDSADSCDVITSDEIMPPVDEDSEEGYHKKYFHLLDAHHVENIVATMEKNFAKLEKNTREDIDKIKRMKEFCLENEGWNVVYIYDL